MQNTHINKKWVGYRDPQRMLTMQTIAAAVFIVLTLLLRRYCLCLKALEKANFNPFDASLAKGGFGVSPLWHALQVKWHLMAKTY